MSRCSICDHFEGYGTNLNILGNPYTKVRWRPNISEFVCDECVESISNTVLELKKENNWDYTVEQTTDGIHKPISIYQKYEQTD